MAARASPSVETKATSVAEQPAVAADRKGRPFGVDPQRIVHRSQRVLDDKADHRRES